MASKRRIRRRSCRYKVRHTSADIALKVLRSNRFKYGVMHVYRCKFCGGWHIGH